MTATCPSGEHVSFGGLVAQFQAPPRSGPIVLPEGMRRTAANRWTVTGVSSSNKIGSRLTAVAYCDTGTTPRTVSRSVKMAAFATVTATAACPAGTVVAGGGFSSGASLEHQELVVQLAATSTQWSVTLRNITGAATSLNVYAYCAHAAAATPHTTTIALAPHKGGTARVGCPSPTKLVFGGLYAHSPAQGTKAAALAPFSWTAATTRQWVVTAYNAGDLEGHLDAIAYCR